MKAPRGHKLRVVCSVCEKVVLGFWYHCRENCPGHEVCYEHDCIKKEENNDV